MSSRDGWRDEKLPTLRERNACEELTDEEFEMQRQRLLEDKNP